MTDDELVSAARQIRDKLDEEGIAVFPATIEDPDFDWPDNENWSAFIDIALRAGPHLLYFWTELFAKDQLDAPLEHQASLADEPDRELAMAIKKGRAYIGKPCRIELGFAHAGMTHRWTAEASWLPALEDIPMGRDTREHVTEPLGFQDSDWVAEQAHRDAMGLAVIEDTRVRYAQSAADLNAALAQVLSERQTPGGDPLPVHHVIRLLTPTLVTRLAPKVAADERFRKARRADWPHVAAEILPEWRQYQDYHLFQSVAEKANELYEPELARIAHALRAEKLTLAQIGGRIHRSASVVTRLLAQYSATGESAAVDYVAGEAAGHKPPA